MLLLREVTSHGPEYAVQVFNRYVNPPYSLQKAAESHAPTFHDVTNRFSRDASLLWLRSHIAETFIFIGIFDTASKRQIVQTAELILDHEIYGQLTLDEFLVFLRKFKQGEYGKIYQSARPNPQEFIMCLRPFWNELMEHRMRAAQKEEEERRRIKEEAERDKLMTRAEYDEIMMLTRMYEMVIPGRE